MTKGFRSTEFWLAIASLACSTFLAYIGAPIEAVLGIAGSSAGYSISRGLAKSKNGE